MLNLSIQFESVLKMIGKGAKSQYQTEYRFHPTRRWRFDFAWPQKMVAVECDGIIWKACGGRHNTDADREKINTAVSMGWRVLRFSGKQIRNEPVSCIDLLLKTLEI